MNSLREIRKYPSAIVGMAIIGFLLLFALYTVVTIPYNEAIRLWRGGDDTWQNYPRTAAPEWTNLFSRTKEPSTIVLDSADASVNRGGTVSTVVEPTVEGKQIISTYTFDFNYDNFPQELAVFFTANYLSKQPHVEMTWTTPDGREIRIGEYSPRRIDSYRFTGDSRLDRRLRGVPARIALFADPDADPPVPLDGTYTLVVDALTFEPESTVDAKFIAYGQVHGVAGTDHVRRDLRVAMMWGTPIALAFGLLAALGTTITTMFIAAFGVWYGGAVDSTIQRITEVNLILPVLPILIMVGTFYSRSIWVMLGVIIILSIFGSSIKAYRALFLQVKESPYIEAARAYGAGNQRIVTQYMVPRIIPLLIPQLVILVPSFVFLEASLAVLGLGDPVLPTWGKLINDAQSNGALYNGYYYWVLQPAVLLIITGLAFAMVGFALDRIFNPRLRGL